MPGPNDPQLVAKALAKVQSVEARLNALVATQGAPVIAYTPVTTVVQQTTAGSYTWTCPAGVTQARIQCWGAGAGGGGGTATIGGYGGGGGAYAEEPYYPVVPGTVYSYVVGDGGDGAIPSTGVDGSPGNPSYFDLQQLTGRGVLANGSPAGVGTSGVSVGGAATPGQAISFSGVPGGGGGGQSTGGCGGAASAASTAVGNNGGVSTSSTGAAGGPSTHGADQGAGGNGGNAGASGAGGSTPGGGGGGCGASALPAGVTVLSYSATSSAAYCGADAIGGSANNLRADSGATLWQDGSNDSDGIYRGTQKSVMILQPGIATALSAVTVDSVILTLLNLTTYYNTGMTVQLGYDSLTALPASYTGGSLTAVQAFTVPQAASHAQQVSDGLGPPLKSGACTALVLGLAPAYDLTYYGSFAGAGQPGAPVLTVVGHTGAAPIIAGDGADGEVRITYSTQGPAVGAIQPSVTTDAAGNALAAGFTGQASAIQPGSSPAVVETWHTASLANSWTGTLSYKLLPHDSVMISGLVTAPGGVANPSLVNTALASAYQPNSTQYLGCVEDPGGAHLGQALICQMTVGGQVQVFDATAGQTLRIFGTYPLDL
jgi:hypothetical protein